MFSYACRFLFGSSGFVFSYACRFLFGSSGFVFSASSVRISGDILYLVVLSGVFCCFIRLLVSFMCFLRLLLLASLCWDGLIDLCRCRSSCVALTFLFNVHCRLGGFSLSLRLYSPSLVLSLSFPDVFFAR